MKRKKNRSSANSSTTSDRNERAKQAIRAKYEAEAQERILNNEKVVNENEIKLERVEFDLKFTELTRKIETAKLSGLKVLKPTFEFETTQIWEDLNRELIELNLFRINKNIAEMKAAIETLSSQNQRCIQEIKQVHKKLSTLSDADIEGEEVPEDVVIDGTPDHPSAS